MDQTTTFNIENLRQELILMELNEIMNSLELAGYNATNQLVGYLLTGDITYITSYKNAREKIAAFDRSEILLTIINGYRGK